MSEHAEQVALFQWAALAAGAQPALDLLYAVPNGGHRHKATARKMKAEGAKAGVPDIVLPVARGGYNALYIELKVGRNKPTRHQLHWLDMLTDAGNLAVVCWGFDDAKRTIEEYLRL